MNNFEALGLSQAVLQALMEMGFETPTEIQRSTVPQLLTNERDFIGLAQTGTGKTAAFGLPLIELIDPFVKKVQALVLAPTRELAQQIAGQLEAFSQYQGDVSTVCVYGGANISSQIRELRKPTQIVVATPGRLIDLMQRNVIDLSALSYLVLDEADEMLNMGFKDELDTILAETPADKLTWLFSATMPGEIRRLIKNYMHDPLEVSVNTKQRVNENIRHQYTVLKASDKTEAVKRLLDFHPDMYGIAFCRTKRDTQKVAEELNSSGYAAEPINGDLSQAQRDAVMKRFRSRTLQLLVATDVAARGIDVDDLTHVIHFSLPDDTEYYTHRSGRTGRAGKTGVSISLVTRSDIRKLRFLENKLGISFEKAQAPDASSIAKNRIEHWAKSILSQDVVEGNEEAYQKAGEVLAELSTEELIRKMVSVELSKTMRKDSALDINDSGKKSLTTEKGKRPGDENMKTFFINIGRVDHFNPGQLLRLICDTTGIKSQFIGRINLQQKHTFFDVDEGLSGKVVPAFRGYKLDGREIRVNRDDNSSPGNKKKKSARNKTRKHRR